MNIEEFEDVFRSHYSPLVSYVRTMVADEDDCHDIVGMAFENILKNLGRIERAKAGAYLYTPRQTMPSTSCADGSCRDAMPNTS